jgi:hypothetical protein
MEAGIAPSLTLFPFGAGGAPSSELDQREHIGKLHQRTGLAAFAGRQLSFSVLPVQQVPKTGMERGRHRQPSKVRGQLQFNAQSATHLVPGKTLPGYYPANHRVSPRIAVPPRRF